jgi:hypothetical protein
MPLLGFFILLTALFCAIHAGKTGRPQFWLYLIVMMPLLGPLAYFAVELLPELWRGPEGRMAATKMRKLVDPHRDLRAAAERAEVAATAQSKADLAEEYLRSGRPEEAVVLYKAALSGIHENEPDLMLGLARALFAKGEFAETQRVLEALREHNPGYQSAPGHLLYARSLEQQNREEAALYEYAALVLYYPGQEAKCRYAELLLHRGEHETAMRLFDQVRTAVERAPRVYAKSQREWLFLAKRRLAGG